MPLLVSPRSLPRWHSSSPATGSAPPAPRRSAPPTLLSAATALVASYLSAEQDLSRSDSAADIAALSATLIGAVDLLVTDHEPGSPDARHVQKAVGTVAVVSSQPSGRSGPPPHSDHRSP
jgi:hypothetical protein